MVKIKARDLGVTRGQPAESVAEHNPRNDETTA